MRQTALGGLNLETKMSEFKWKVAHIFPAAVLGRSAFLALLRLNIFGLSTVFSKRVFFVSDAVTATQKEPNFWWDYQKRLRIGWHNLGGKWDSLTSAINAGKGKKAIGISIAPKTIKDAYKNQGINGSGIGIEPATLTLLATAGTILGALGGIIASILNNSNLKNELKAVGVESNKQIEEAARQREEAAKNRAFEIQRQKLDNEAKGKESGESFSFTGEDGKVTTAGYGIIGVGILGMLYLGTMKKNKSKK
tara:strand:- start:222 stop:974 length:753 start_codon:yes stop_codon:yes gene_type:complete